MSKRKEKPAVKKRQPEKKFKIPRNVQMFIILALAVSLLFVGVGGYLRLFGAGSSAVSGGGSSQPVHSGSNEQNVEPARYSEGLEFTSNGDGTCSVSGIGTCTDTDLIIPSVSPDGDRVTRIGNEAFRRCRSLTSVTIPDSVTSIGYAAFQACLALTSINIPDSVTSIGNSLFDECISLISVTIPRGIPYIGYSMFHTCSSLTSITIPDSVTSIGSSAFSGCNSLTSITIPGSVTIIETSAFYSCNSLTSVSIYALVPPTMQHAGVFDKTNNCPIYVPAASVEAYKTATNWSAYADRIFPLEAGGDV